MSGDRAGCNIFCATLLGGSPEFVVPLLHHQGVQGLYSRGCSPVLETYFDFLKMFYNYADI